MNYVHTHMHTSVCTYTCIQLVWHGLPTTRRRAPVSSQATLASATCTSHKLSPKKMIGKLGPCRENLMAHEDTLEGKDKS